VPLSSAFSPLSDPPSRRELNRLATRSAITGTVLSLAETEDFSTVTVERVAEEAGVSRRTFFNYFRSLEEALHEPLRELVARTAVRMEAQDPTGTDILGLLSRTLDEVLSLELLEPTARVLLITRDNPELREAGLRTWDDCVRSLIPPAGEGTPALRLYLSTLVRSAIAVAQAAFETWAERLVQPLTEDEVMRLRGLVAQGLGLLGDGFALPPWLTPEDLASCPPLPTPGPDGAPASPTASTGAQRA
jgi:AcrR family transcriptional regulator